MVLASLSHLEDMAGLKNGEEEEHFSSAHCILQLMIGELRWCYKMEKIKNIWLMLIQIFSKALPAVSSLATAEISFALCWHWREILCLSNLWV